MTQSLAQELKNLNDKLEASQETELSLKELSARLSHTIKNSLSLVMVALQYLQTKINQSERPLIATVLAKLEKLDQLAAGLSSFVRPRTFSLKPLKINKILETDLHLISRRCQAKRINLETEFNAFLPLVDGDLASLSETILHLLKNAVEATPKNGEFSVITKRQKNEVVLIIKDSGMGISKKNAENIFKPFFTTKKDHLGLGLAHAQKIVLGHGGKITFSSRTKGKDRGCEFVIHLPISQSDSWWKRL